MWWRDEIVVGGWAESWGRGECQITKWRVMANTVVLAGHHCVCERLMEPVRAEGNMAWRSRPQSGSSSSRRASHTHSNRCERCVHQQAKKGTRAGLHKTRTRAIVNDDNSRSDVLHARHTARHTSASQTRQLKLQTLPHGLKPTATMTTPPRPP